MFFHQYGQKSLWGYWEYLQNYSDCLKLHLLKHKSLVTHERHKLELNTSFVGTKRDFIERKRKKTPIRAVKVDVFSDLITTVLFRICSLSSSFDFVN